MILGNSYQGMRVQVARYYGSVYQCHTGKILDLISHQIILKI